MPRPMSPTTNLDYDLVAQCTRTLASTGPRNNDHVKAARTLKQLSDEPGNRNAMAMTGGVVEALSLTLLNVDSSKEGMLCGQFALVTLQNFTVEDPLIDVYICNEENLIPGVVNILNNSHELLHELSALLLDYLSILKDNQTLICTSDNVLTSVTNVLQNTVVLNTREHLLQCLIYLSSNHKNLFMMARQSQLLDTLAECMDSSHQRGVTSKALQIVANLCRLRENIPSISRNSTLLNQLHRISNLWRDDPEAHSVASTIFEILNDYKQEIEQDDEMLAAQAQLSRSGGRAKQGPSRPVRRPSQREAASYDSASQDGLRVDREVELSSVPSKDSARRERKQSRKQTESRVDANQDDERARKRELAEKRRYRAVERPTVSDDDTIADEKTSSLSSHVGRKPPRARPHDSPIRAPQVQKEMDRAMGKPEPTPKEKTKKPSAKGALQKARKELERDDLGSEHDSLSTSGW